MNNIATMGKNLNKGDVRFYLCMDKNCKRPRSPVAEAKVAYLAVEKALELVHKFVIL